MVIHQVGSIFEAILFLVFFNRFILGTVAGITIIMCIVGIVFGLVVGIFRTRILARLSFKNPSFIKEDL